jgi:hypothetical protein
MNVDLENKFKLAVKDNNLVDLWNLIEKACKYELGYYISNHSKLDNLAFEESVLKSQLMIYRRLTSGMLRGPNKGKKLEVNCYGSYCYSVVVFEYIKLLKERAIGLQVL